MTPLDPARDLVAYFSAEFAVDERLPIYAGGLGVLAGDHLKTASDFELPLVAVGLLYGEGYFEQELDAEGRQQALPARYDVQTAALELMRDPLGRELTVRAPMADHVVHLRVWRKAVGGISLFLLDSDLQENLPDDRPITRRLYEAGQDIRLRQEIVLGIGGVRALRALGLQPTVWHINEGHAAMLVLERIREHVAWGYSFGAALETVAASTVFTTHTPVPAGHDIFNHQHLRHWLGEYIAALHATERRLFTLGVDAGDASRFSMTALALRGSRFRNAVSRLHRSVAARMERYIWPQVPPEENPLDYVTNGVHLPSILSWDWQNLFDRHIENWRKRPIAAAEFGFLEQLADAELRDQRQRARQVLLAEIRTRVAVQLQRVGRPDSLIASILQRLEQVSPGTAVLGFARRFATYKRATLLLRDPARLQRLLSDPQRPALLVFAGKAHPHDAGGQEMIRQLYEHSLRPEFAGRLIVLEGYDLVLARALVQGCDVWLNTPEYPMEASGTSGMKAGANGCVNVSVLDGWWAEGYDGANGFAVEPSGLPVPGERDAAEALQLFELLEQRVLPEYYAEGEAPSGAWLRRVRNSVRSIASQYGSGRMLDEYRQRFYGPAAALGRRLDPGVRKVATNFARWKRLTQQNWPGVRIHVGGRDPLLITVETNGLPSGSVAAEAVTADGVVLPLDCEAADHDQARFVLKQPPSRPLRQVRVVPFHALLPHRYEVGLMTVVELT